MLKNRFLSSAMFVAGGLFASAALANTDGGMQHGQDVSFEKVDENGDGYISRTEFDNAGLPQQVELSSLDADADGRVDRTEFAAFEQMSQDESQQSQPYPETYPQQGTEQPSGYETPESAEPESDY